MKRPLKNTLAPLVSAGALVFLPGLSSGSSPPLQAQAVAEKAGEEVAGETGKKAEEYRAALDRMDEARNGRAILVETEFLAEEFPDSRDVVVDAARKGSERQRRFAIKLLGEEGSTEEDLEIVLPALGDHSRSVRLAAVMATRKLGPDDKALSVLLKYLRSEDDPNNLKMAVKTLSHWRQKESVPHLVALLEKTEDQGVANFCVGALRRLTGKQYGKNPETWRAFVDAQEALRHELYDGHERDGKKEK